LCRYKITKNFWTQHIATGVIASVSQGISAGSGYDALGKFASEALSTFAYNAFDGKGFTDDYGDMHGAFNWQSFAPKAEYVGMFLGKMAGDYLSAENVDKTQDSSKSSSPVGGTDPLSGVEDMLGAAWQGLKGIKDSIKDIQDKITELTGEKFDDFTGGLLRGANEGLFGFGENIGEGFTAFAQRTGNWISDGLFGNELEPVVGYGRVAGYEPDLKEINLPTLRSNTNAQKLINNLAAQHGVDPNDMMEILIASNGVESVDDLQQLIRDGVQLKSVENFGWEKGMQGKYYADYDRMLAQQKALLDVNASLRQAELGTHGEANAIWFDQHINGNVPSIADPAIRRFNEKLEELGNDMLRDGLANDSSLATGGGLILRGLEAIIPDNLNGFRLTGGNLPLPTGGYSNSMIADNSSWFGRIINKGYEWIGGPQAMANGAIGAANGYMSTKMNNPDATNGELANAMAWNFVGGALASRFSSLEAGIDYSAGKRALYSAVAGGFTNTGYQVTDISLNNGSWNDFSYTSVGINAAFTSLNTIGSYWLGNNAYNLRENNYGKWGNWLRTDGTTSIGIGLNTTGIATGTDYYMKEKNKKKKR